jgi:hypothetical protein
MWDVTEMAERIGKCAWQSGSVFAMDNMVGTVGRGARGMIVFVRNGRRKHFACSLIGIYTRPLRMSPLESDN